MNAWGDGVYRLAYLPRLTQPRRRRTSCRRCSCSFCAATNRSMMRAMKAWLLRVAVNYVTCIAARGTTSIRAAGEGRAGADRGRRRRPASLLERSGSLPEPQRVPNPSLRCQEGSA